MICRLYSVSVYLVLTLHCCHGGECLVSCLTVTMSPLTRAGLGLCLVLCLLLRPWESGLVVAACCLLLRWEAGRVASLGNTTLVLSTINR